MAQLLAVDRALLLRILGVSERTADNYWAYAKVWLIREMQAQRR